MNLKRFQFAVNHQDPEVVLAGLNEFIQALVHEDERVGQWLQPTVCNLTSEEVALPWTPADYDACQPMLSHFLASSPQAEEFFSLWQFPTIEYDHELCATTFDCLSVLIECLPKTSPSLSGIVYRINHVHVKFILFQLEKKKQQLRLRHSILRLLLAVMRKQVALSDDLVHHLLLTPFLANKSSSTSGKEERNGDGEEEEQPPEQDKSVGQYFLIKWIFTFILQADLDLAQQFLTHGPNLDALIHQLPLFSVAAYSLFLSGLVRLCEEGSRIQETIMQKLLTTSVFEKIIMSGEVDRKGKEERCNAFLSLLLEILPRRMKSKEEKTVQRGLSTTNARKVISTLLSLLDPVHRPVHAEVGDSIILLCRLCASCE